VLWNWNCSVVRGNILSSRLKNWNNLGKFHCIRKALFWTGWLNGLFVRTESLKLQNFQVTNHVLHVDETAVQGTFEGREWIFSFSRTIRKAETWRISLLLGKPTLHDTFVTLLAAIRKFYQYIEVSKISGG